MINTHHNDSSVPVSSFSSSSPSSSPSLSCLTIHPSPAPSPASSPSPSHEENPLSDAVDSDHSLPDAASSSVPPPSVSPVFISRWGELYSSPPPPLFSPSELRHRMERDRERELKWLEMKRKWSKLQGSALLKSRVRKGIPDSFRSFVWSSLGNCSHQRSSNPSLYSSLLQQSSEFEIQIAKDIARTFPQHILFKDEANGSNGLRENVHSSSSDSKSESPPPSSSGRSSLFNVLKAYSIHHPAVGYCQGMGFIVGMFLMYLSEEDSFYLLCSILRSNPSFQLFGLYMKDFPLLFEYNSIYSDLLTKLCPRLAAHLSSVGINSTVYTTQWFFTLFICEYPMEICLRIMDIFLLEGPKIIFRFAIEFMKLIENEALKIDEFPDLITLIKNIPNRPDINGNKVDEIVQEAMNLPISRKQIAKYSEKYNQQLLNKANTNNTNNKKQNK